MNEQLQLLTEVTAFIWTEADMLDHAEYQSWLALWKNDGKYIIPIDPALTDYENHLNYAYDDQHMRKLRIERLESGEAISTQPKANTVRSVSRIRILEHDEKSVIVRCAQNLSEFRKQHLRKYTADVTYQLVRQDDEFKIQNKVINLINSTDTLAGISYIL